MEMSLNSSVYRPAFALLIFLTGEAPPCLPQQVKNCVWPAMGMFFKISRSGLKKTTLKKRHLQRMLSLGRRNDYSHK